MGIFSTKKFKIEKKHLDLLKGKIFNLSSTGRSPTLTPIDYATWGENFKQLLKKEADWVISILMLKLQLRTKKFSKTS